MVSTVDELAIKKTKLEIKKVKENAFKSIMEHLKEIISENEVCIQLVHHVTHC